ncbi:hypothetical protein HZA85_02415 [Candidatus Uhrbacteria bacterium]|nr:hypothetical protein [Candidatus Uhrbacteria bacterium]
MTDWLSMLKPKTLSFLEKLHETDGYYRYSLTSDVFTNYARSNLAGSVFALKLFAMFGETDPSKIQPTIDRILSFQQSDGTFSDPFVARRRLVRHVLSNLKRGDLHNLGNAGYIRAETRQAYCALLLYDVIPKHILTDVPTTPADIHRFLSRLDWSHPWGAGSHFSHLMFFLTLMRKANRIDEATYRQARDTAVTFIASLQHKDGAWYVGNPSHRQKINGAMKVISGLMVDPLPFDHPDRLIDLCLTKHTYNTDDACDQINQVFVLRHSNQLLDGRYRQEDLQSFCLEALDQWRAYFYSELGGFSFHQGRANERYYSAKVSLGLNEPDIHGTVMFVWGLSMLKHLLPIQALQPLKEIPA